MESCDRHHRSLRESIWVWKMLQRNFLYRAWSWVFSSLFKLGSRLDLPISRLTNSCFASITHLYFINQEGFPRLSYLLLHYFLIDWDFLDIILSLLGGCHHFTPVNRCQRWRWSISLLNSICNRENGLFTLFFVNFLFTFQFRFVDFINFRENLLR